MFDTEYAFEELPIMLGSTEVASCTGTALLEGEIGPHDYGFFVTGIVLEGNRVGDYRDKRNVQICPRSDDPFGVLLFRILAERIEDDGDAAEHFSLAAREHLASVA